METKNSSVVLVSTSYIFPYTRMEKVKDLVLFGCCCSTCVRCCACIGHDISPMYANIFVEQIVYNLHVMKGKKGQNIQMTEKELQKEHKKQRNKIIHEGERERER